MSESPIEKFKATLARAEEDGIVLFNAGSLATATRDGRPSVRVVLLKSVDDGGFVFYTNLESPKARDMAENPRAALCFWWSSLDEQIRVEGEVELVSDSEADEYFATRDRESQIGAWASRQSAPVGSREELLGAFKEMSTRYEDKTVPRPPRWGGYRLIPERIEFWYSRPHRLHERVLYERSGDDWKASYLYP